jgi:hypothetical protein
MFAILLPPVEVFIVLSTGIFILLDKWFNHEKQVEQFMYMDNKFEYYLWKYLRLLILFVFYVYSYFLVKRLMVQLLDQYQPALMAKLQKQKAATVA